MWPRPKSVLCWITTANGEHMSAAPVNDTSSVRNDKVREAFDFVHQSIPFVL